MIRSLVERYRLAIREARFIRVSLLLSACLNLVTWAMVMWFVLPRLDENPFFAFHYTIYFGADRIGPAWRLALAPLFGLALLLVNLLIALKSWVGDRLVSVFFMCLTVMFQILLGASAFLNILANL